MKKWKLKKSELVLTTRSFKVRKDTVELPSKGTFDLVYWDSNDSAMVIGMARDRKLVLTRQYRYLVGGNVIEFPAGGLKDSESPEAGARREMEEETGFRCGRLVPLRAFYETYGHLNRRIHIFFCKELTKTRQRLDLVERNSSVKVEFVSLDTAVGMALKNELVASASALAIMLLYEKINRKEIRI